MPLLRHTHKLIVLDLDPWMHVILICYLMKCCIPKCNGCLQEQHVWLSAANCTSHFSTEHHFYWQTVIIHAYIFDISLKMNWMDLSFQWKKQQCLLQVMHLVISNRNLNLGKLLSTVNNLRLFYTERTFLPSQISKKSLNKCLIWTYLSLWSNLKFFFRV